ncbi:regulatory protein RecX [Streptomyces sp. L7]|uniref:regulatory protein RecX n=3 Tax=Actinomycetes TaxID=1760 RepID=UPI003D9566E9
MGASGSEHVAPVTPLRRTGAAPKRERSAEPGVVRPVAELPGVQGVRARESRAAESSSAESSSAESSAAESSAAESGEASTRWNNTWAAEPAQRSSTVDAAASPDDGTVSVNDEESERLTRKASGLTIRQLARRGMSRWELEQLLTKREIAPEVFGPELDRLEAMGVIDDASLAATLAFTQHSRKGLGRSAIELDLKRRHIAPELIEEALADIADEDELERATELAVKRIGLLSSYDDETARRRLHGFLARKGYDSSVVRQAMDAAFATRGRRGGVRFQ